MVELSVNSTSVISKAKKTSIAVRKKKSASSPSSCDVSLYKERLKDILDNIPSAVVVIEKPDGVVTYANKRAIELHGTDPCGIELKKHATSLKILTLEGKICPTKELYTYRALYNEEAVRDAPIVIERPYGQRAIVNVSAKPLYDKDGKVNVAIAVFDDITESTKTQEALKESEERLNMAQRIAHLGSWEYYVKEDRAVWSEELFRIFGLPVQKYGPKVTDYVAQIHPADREPMNKIMERVLFAEGLGSMISFDYRIIRQDGSVRMIHSERVVREVDEHNKPVRIVGIEQDITERKQNEQKLENYAKNLERLVEERTKKISESEQSYRELYESFGEAFIATDWELNVIHWNKTAERITKISVEEALGKKVYDLFPEMSTIDITNYYESLRDRKPARFMMNTASRETGNEAVFEISTYPSTLGIIIIVEDKTEEERTKRLSAIGQTAGMIGHDIRNPLQAIAGELFLVTQEIESSPDSQYKRSVQESLNAIQQQVDYINKIVSDLQDYARPLKPDLVEVDLCTAIPQLVSTVPVPSNVQAIAQCDRQLPKLKLDLTFLQRILINLATNAVQAMPNGGKLTIKTFEQDNGVCITVTDTGVGIPDEIKPKLFQPLITTKARGQGFGLAVVKRLIEAQGGSITVESQVGKGTQFKITFSEKKAKPHKHKPTDHHYF